MRNPHTRYASHIKRLATMARRNSRFSLLDTRCSIEVRRAEWMFGIDAKRYVYVAYFHSTCPTIRAMILDVSKGESDVGSEQNK